MIEIPHNARGEVLGTSFNLEAFPNDSTISTTYLRGFVYGKEVKIKSGEKIVYNTVQNRHLTFNTTGESECSWKDGKLIFQDTPFL